MFPVSCCGPTLWIVGGASERGKGLERLWGRYPGHVPCLSRYIWLCSHYAYMRYSAYTCATCPYVIKWVYTYVCTVAYAEAMETIRTYGRLKRSVNRAIESHVLCWFLSIGFLNTILTV